MVPIRQNLAPSSKWGVKCPYSMTPTRIVVHNTYNDAPATNEISYMLGNSNKTSYHYAVDDKEIIQAVLENRNAWHSEDGNGKGNREGIGIEICYSKSGGDKFIKAEQNAAEFIASLLKKYGWGIDKVTKHQDYSGKYCPHRTLDMGWDRFINMVKSYMEEDIDMGKLEELENKVDEAIENTTKVINEMSVQIEKLENPMIYGYIDENMPEWARPTIQKLVDKGFLKGDGSGVLNLDDNMLKMLVINDRAGLYGENEENA